MTDEEITNVFNQLKSSRDQALFTLGCKSGLRISELLSLRVQDVLEYGQIGSKVTVAKKNTKGKIESKTIPLAPSAREALKAYLGDQMDPKEMLFRGRGHKAISRVQAHRILKDAFNSLRLTGKVACHSMRKTFAHRVHKALGSDIMKTQIALSHKNLNSTVQYLQVDREEVEAAVLGLG